MVNAAYGDKHYSIRMFSDGVDDFVMDEKTLKTTPGVAGLQSVAMTTMSRRFLNCRSQTRLADRSCWITLTIDSVVQ